MISFLGALFILAAAISIAIRPEWLVWVLAAAVPLTATAGINVAGQSLVMYPLIAIVLIVLYVQQIGLDRVLQADLSKKRGSLPLLVFVLWACVVTVVGPTMFSGIAVLDPKQGIDEGVAAPAKLAFALSNIAQSGYLVIGIATVAVLGTRARLSPHLPAMAFGLGTVLSSLRYALPESLQKQLFDTSTNVAYTAGEFNGIERLRGVFSEPSALGAFSVAGAVFFLAASVRLNGSAKLLYLALGVWSFTNAVYSFSGGALLTGLAVIVLIAAKAALTVVLGKSTIRVTSVLMILATPAAVLVFGGAVFGFIQLMLSDKSSSSSYENRTAADQFSYQLAQDTYGLGVGLGSNRPSSFAASLVSTVGYFGALLLVVAIGTIFTLAMRRLEYQPAAWALLTILVSKALAGPDISDPPLWFLLGVCAHAAWAPVARAREVGQNYHSESWPPLIADGTAASSAKGRSSGVP